MPRCARTRASADIDLPTLVAWGTEDTWIPVDRAHRLAGLIPGAELELIPAAGHLVQLDAPEQLSALLQRWLHRALLDTTQQSTVRGNG